MSLASAPGPERPIDVLAVDDSAVVREVIAAVLSPRLGFRVAAAADPLIALEKMRQRRPDVILLDLELPRMDGLTFLRKVMREDPIPTVVCSSLAADRSEYVLRSLEEGAVDVVCKPRLGAGDFLHESAAHVVEVVRAAAKARLPARLRQTGSRGSSAAGGVFAALRPAAPERLVALGASTGGTEALRCILEAMPAAAPPMVVVQHMPEAFTRPFAERLARTCAVEVRQAEEGDRLRPGLVLVAPGNRHLRVVDEGTQLCASLSRDPPVNRHRPSVDVLFDSVALAARGRAVGVLLTGMGADGAEGLLALRKAGAATLAQDEASSVVFGMPREAILRGAAQEVVPLDRMAPAILRHARVGGGA